MGDRAEVGERPAAAAAGAISARVKIESIDRERGIVVFSLASGELIARRLRTSEGREFVKGLAVGDVVQLDYTVAMALGVEKLGTSSSERESDAK
jgi:myo-inositol catabolism protein IolC